MNPEINFYQCDDTISHLVAPLLLKILEENKKALIVAENAMQVKEIDNGLWGYGKNKFIPHVTVFDKDFEFPRQPILVSDKEENLNGADFLVVTKEVNTGFIQGFSRVFYFYNSLNENLAKDLAAKYKPISSKFKSYKKEAGKWISNVQ